MARSYKLFFICIILFQYFEVFGQVFSELDSNFLDVTGPAKWCDVDSDGDLDLLVFGEAIDENGDTFFSGNLYLNKGSGVFDEFHTEAIPNATFSVSIDLGDFNADNQIDFLISGTNYDGKFTKILKNEIKSKGEISEYLALNDFQGTATWVSFYNPNENNEILSKYIIKCYNPI